MTNNKLTDERLSGVLCDITDLLGGIDPMDDKDNYEMFDDMRSAVRELQEYRNEPPISFYRDGIATAAKWVDQQRESYDNEHGRHDPDTGVFEFGNDAQRDYSETLMDIAEGIRALHPNADIATQTLTDAERAELQEYRKAEKPWSIAERTDLRTAVISEISAFFDDSGHPGEVSPGEMNRQLTMRVGRILNDHIVNYPRCEALAEILKECRIARDAAQAELQEYRKAKPVMFIDGDISPSDAKKLVAAIHEFNSEPVELFMTESPALRDVADERAELQGGDHGQSSKS